MLIGLVALYKPSKEEMNNIEKYVDGLDYCFLIDDSGESNKDICSELIEKYPDKMEYYCNPQNVGLCASVNNGFHMAEERGAKWVLVMNPDGTFYNDAISIYREYIDNNDTRNIAILAPRFNIDRRPKEAGKGSVEIKHPDMTGCLYNMDILRELGYYDENTYFYSLDFEYCLRVRKNGYKIIECSEAVLNHNPAETFNVKIFGKTVFKCGKDNPTRYYYQFRSFYYVNKLYHNMYFAAFHGYKILKVVFFFENKKEYFKMIKLGISDAKRGYFGNINKR